ncbi:hypothetical protein GT031_32650 [Streptomyces sp. SID2888]|nr:hypothetical protein [Streptomyces sp. SID2888]
MWGSTPSNITGLCSSRSVDRAATADTPTSGTNRPGHASVESDRGRTPNRRHTPGEPAPKSGRRFTSHPARRPTARYERPTRPRPATPIQVGGSQNGRQLLLRGEDGARGEWRLLAACHNFRKAFRHAGTAGLAAANA